MKNLTIYGSCQLTIGFKYFLTEELLLENDLYISDCLNFFEYDDNFYDNCVAPKLDYERFDICDIMIIEINSLKNQASSDKILDYMRVNNPKCKIIKTPLIYFPFFPFNKSGYGIITKEKFKDKKHIKKYLNTICYKTLFNTCLDNFRIYNDMSDIDIYPFIKNNMEKTRLFNDCLHPTNVVLLEAAKLILQKLNIDVKEHDLSKEIIPRTVYGIILPYTTKMINDLDVKYHVPVNDNYYFKILKKYCTQ